MEFSGRVSAYRDIWTRSSALWKNKKIEPDWWYMPVILILGRQRQDCYTSKPSLVYRVSFKLAITGEAMSKAPKVRW